jgi:hypothetical protein
MHDPTLGISNDVDAVSGGSLKWYSPDWKRVPRLEVETTQKSMNTASSF